eukprot:CAMPEP_0198422672 /NCGR_PEP_ID=MMETSP1452-20131203/2551_1 /TAXON_ID=1181717 /ORGANISM="Synchroma pusillum, Strain CCMP3072" /LENGTH=105 /DNA_ID=CAMNT_0044142947 /DNA_START=94 /DNA_END=411 /DNA_ORIENTATION=+
MPRIEDIPADTSHLERNSAANYHLTRAVLAREYLIAVERMKIVREDLKVCVLREGVNQYHNCRELRERYFNLCMDRFRGMTLPPGFEPTPEQRQIPGLEGPYKKF